MKISNSTERLKELMNVYNLKQADICKKTGLDRSVISYYVNGKREPMQDNILLIANSYGIDPAWLMGMDVPMVKDVAAEKYTVHLAELANIVINDERLATIVECYTSLSDAQKESVKTLLLSMANL